MRTSPIQRLVVFGACSAISKAVLRSLALEKTSFLLIGKDPHELERLSRDLSTRGSFEAKYLCSDLSQIQKHEDLFLSIEQQFAGYDSALIAYGTLPDQILCEKNPSLAVDSIQTNYSSAVSLLLRLADHFESRAQGRVAVITSVAGDLGRRSNYVYGSSKAGLSIFLEGLRSRLYMHGVSVTDIRPGFVDTPMTSGYRKNFLFSSPEDIAPKIVRSMKRGKPVAYVPGYWRWILLFLKLVPRRILYKLPI